VQLAAPYTKAVVASALQLLRDAGALGTWMVRAHVSNRRALRVMVDFAPPWTEARVRELLQPLFGDRLELVCFLWSANPLA
jgi:hypothetical protein